MFERIKRGLFGAPRAFPEPKQPVPIVRPLHEAPTPSVEDGPKAQVEEEVGIAHEIKHLESEVARLQRELGMAQNNLQTWVNAESSLHFNATIARADNQAASHGFMGALFGPESRAARHEHAIWADASIVKNTAIKHREIAAKKGAAAQHVMWLQSRLAQATQLLGMKKASVYLQEPVASARSKSIDLLHKLKEAHELGLLTDAEYEEKRARLAKDI